MELLHSLPYTKPNGVVVPVGSILIPNAVVSTTKASLLAGISPTEYRITPDMNQHDAMKVDLKAFRVVGVSVYQDGEDKVIKMFME